MAKDVLMIVIDFQLWFLYLVRGRKLNAKYSTLQTAALQLGEEYSNLICTCASMMP